MHFNEAVLRAITNRCCQNIELAPDVQSSIDSLSLESLGVELFSQVVHDSFASSSWFDLLRILDGNTPGPCHDAVALAAAEGRVRAVVTTNFDTLFERAFDELNVPYVVQTGLDDLASSSDPLPNECTILKVHGSVTTAMSLVDLSAQKALGLRGNLRERLTHLFTGKHVLVVGFSGADLGLAPDYLGLLEAAPFLRSLRWVSRPGRDPHPEASRVVASIPGAEFVIGSLPDALEGLGFANPAPRSARSQTDFESAVQTWVEQVHCSPELCLACLARILVHSGSVEAADRLSSVVLERARTRTSSTTQIERYSHAVSLSHLGSVLIGRRNEKAIRILRKSAELQAHLILAWHEPSPAAIQEHLSNYTGALLNLGSALAHAGTAFLAEAESVARAVRSSLPDGSRLLDREAGLHLLDAAISRARRDDRMTLLSLRDASELAAVTGNSNLGLIAMENRARMALSAGEVDLAALHFRQADRLHKRSIGALPRELGVADLLESSGTERSAGTDYIIARLREELDAGGGRIDELLFGLLAFAFARAGAAECQELADAIHRLLLEELPADPLCISLVALAHCTLDGGTDSELAKHQLAEWIRAQVDRPLRSIGSRLVVHSEMQRQCGELGDSWSTEGGRLLRSGQTSQAFGCFVAASGAYVLTRNVESATRDFLRASHVLDLEGRLDVSGSILEWLLFDAGPSTSRLVHLRLVKHLAHRVRSGEDTMALLARAGDLLEDAGQTKDEELGAALVAYADMLFVAGNPSASRRAALDAAALLIDPAHISQANAIAERAT